jgi:hypothetical protein
MYNTLVKVKNMLQSLNNEQPLSLAASITSNNDLVRQIETRKSLSDLLSAIERSKLLSQANLAHYESINDRQQQSIDHLPFQEAHDLIASQFCTKYVLAQFQDDRIMHMNSIRGKYIIIGLKSGPVRVY